MSQYIHLIAEERAPEVYKPRKGKINNNRDKFDQHKLGFIMDNATDLINNLGYASLFGASSDFSSLPTNEWISEHNNRSLQQSLQNHDPQSLLVNADMYYLRRRTDQWPAGRTQYRQLIDLRKFITLVGGEKEEEGKEN